MSEEKALISKVVDEVTGVAHFEAHGDRWASLGENSASVLAEIFGCLWGDEKLKVLKASGGYAMLIQPSGDCRAVAVVSPSSEGGIWVDSVCPVMVGKKFRMRVLHIHEWSVEEHAEADIYAEVEGLGEFPFTFFDPFWCRDREKIVVGEEADFWLSAWAYQLMPALGKVQAEKGQTILKAHEVASEYLFFTKADEVCKTQFCGFPVYRLAVDFVSGSCPVQGNLYVPEFVLGGFAPQVGDEVMARIWLCGFLEQAEFSDSESDTCFSS